MNLDDLPGCLLSRDCLVVLEQLGDPFDLQTSLAIVTGQALTSFDQQMLSLSSPPIDAASRLSGCRLHNWSKSLTGLRVSSLLLLMRPNHVSAVANTNDGSL